MAISRAQMGSQLKGNRMAKKTKKPFPDLNNDGKITKADILKGRGVSKKQGGGLAGMDPAQQGAAAPVAGKQAMQQAVAQAAEAVKARRPRKNAAPLMRKAQGMNAGGRVGRRGDGICQRGKTKGTMR